MYHPFFIKWNAIILKEDFYSTTASTETPTGRILNQRRGTKFKGNGFVKTGGLFNRLLRRHAREPAMIMLICYLYHNLDYGCQRISFRTSDVMKYGGLKSRQPVYDAIEDLIKRTAIDRIIESDNGPATYLINPRFMHRGKTSLFIYNEQERKKIREYNSKKQNNDRSS